MAFPHATTLAIIWFNQRQPKSAVAELAWQIMVRAELCAFVLGGMQNCMALILLRMDMMLSWRAGGS